MKSLLAWSTTRTLYPNRPYLYPNRPKKCRFSSICAAAATGNKNVQHPPDEEQKRSSTRPTRSSTRPTRSSTRPTPSVFFRSLQRLQKNDLSPPLMATTDHSLRWYESHSRPAASATGNRSLTAHKTSPRHTNAPPTTKKWRSGHVWPLKPHHTRHSLSRPTPAPKKKGRSAGQIVGTTDV